MFTARAFLFGIAHLSTGIRRGWFNAIIESVSTSRLPRASSTALLFGLAPDHLRFVLSLVFFFFVLKNGLLRRYYLTELLGVAGNE